MEPCFFGPEGEDFDLHDYLKALQLRAHSNPSRTEDKALTYSCRLSVAWRLSIALYCKAVEYLGSSRILIRNGIFGVSYALRPNHENDPRS